MSTFFGNPAKLVYCYRKTSLAKYLKTYNLLSSCTEEYIFTKIPPHQVQRLFTPLL